MRAFLRERLLSFALTIFFRILDNLPPYNPVSYKGLEQFLPYYEIEIAIATLPAGLDPCDLLVRPGGVETFNKALATAVDALDFSLDRLFEQTLSRTRDSLESRFNAFASETQKAYQQLRQEILGEKKFSDAESWALVSYLMQEGRSAEMEKFVAEILASKPREAAFSL